MLLPSTTQPNLPLFLTLFNQIFHFFSRQHPFPQITWCQFHQDTYSIYPAPLPPFRKPIPCFDAFLNIDLRTASPEGGDDESLVVRQDENERRTEFRKSIDLNGDGKADRRELLHYVAPQSPRHSEHEAEALLALADGDQDNALSLDEILAHPNLFLKSKMVDTARSFHDEF